MMKLERKKKAKKCGGLLNSIYIYTHIVPEMIFRLMPYIKKKKRERERKEEKKKETRSLAK